MAPVSTKKVDEAVDELRKAIKKRETVKNGAKPSVVREVVSLQKVQVKHEPIRLHLSDINTCSRTWSDARTGITWCHITDDNLEIFCERVMSILAETHPHYITISAFQLYFRYESEEELTKAVAQVLQEAHASGRHRVTISSLRFNPEDERWWAEIGAINTKIRAMHVKYNLQPLALHKIFITRDDKLNGYVIRANYFIEYNERKSLGGSPTERAVQMIAD